MPRLSIYIVRLSLVYLVLGTTIGAVILLDRAFNIAPFIWTVRPLHVEFLLFGWFFQLAFGVASWIFPRTSDTPSSSRLTTAIWLLNAGILAAGFGQMLPIGGGLLVGRLAELAGVVTFATYIWPRVRKIRMHSH